MAGGGYGWRAMDAFNAGTATFVSLLVVIVGAGMAGCNRSSDEPVPAPRVTQAPATAVPPPVAADATPKASEVFKQGLPPGKESNNQQQADPAHTLTKQEESTSMPMAGQANDHSTLAKDPSKR